MPDITKPEPWSVFLKNSLRFYRLEATQDVELLFTTRRAADGSPDHNLDVRDQFASFRWRNSLVIMNQTHSDKVVEVINPGVIEADGCFTTQPGLALSVRVADCVPIFLWDEEKGLIGAAHAGWRGTLAKIALKLTEKIEKVTGVSPHRLIYVLGPSIGKCCYEVGEDVMNSFSKSWSEADRFLSKRGGRSYLDLRDANRFLLDSVGAREGQSLNLCTSCEHMRFYSHRHEPGKGRNWGVIVRGIN